MLAPPPAPAQHRLIDLETNYTMSTTATTSATTTYPFTYTTFSNASPSPFTEPTEVPSIFSFGSALNCASNSVKPTPSALPIDKPLGLQPACVISNAAEVNDHAFWDLYACCKGGDMTAFGSPGTCTAQCRAEDGQTWQELGECLSKRVEYVVCKPEFSEIGRNETEQSSGSAAQSTRTTAASGTGSASGSATGSGSGVAQQSTGGAAASTVGVVHATNSKVGVVMFALLAFGSAAGMFL